MKIALITCLAGLMMTANTSLTAQEADTSLAKRYERETILLNYPNNTFVKNKESRRSGIFGRKMEKEFEGVSAEAKTEFKGHQKKKKLGVGLLIAGGTVMLGSLVAAPVLLLPAAATLFFTGSGTYLGGGLFLNRSQRHLQKAVWLHNRDVIVKS